MSNKEKKAIPLRAPIPKQLYILLGDIYSEIYQEEREKKSSDFLLTRFLVDGKKYLISHMGSSDDAYHWEEASEKISEEVERDSCLEIEHYHNKGMGGHISLFDRGMNYQDHHVLFKAHPGFFTGSPSISTEFSVSFTATFYYLQNPLECMASLGNPKTMNLAARVLKSVAEKASRPLDDSSLPLLIAKQHQSTAENQTLYDMIGDMLDPDIQLHDDQVIYNPSMTIVFARDKTTIDIVDDIGLLRRYAKALEPESDHTFKVITDNYLPSLLPTQVRLERDYDKGSLILPWNGD